METETVVDIDLCHRRNDDSNDKMIDFFQLHSVFTVLVTAWHSSGRYHRGTGRLGLSGGLIIETILGIVHNSAQNSTSSVIHKSMIIGFIEVWVNGIKNPGPMK